MRRASCGRSSRTGVFEEPEFDRFRLNAAGELPRRDVPGDGAAVCRYGGRSI